MDIGIIVTVAIAILTAWITSQRKLTSIDERLIAALADVKKNEENVLGVKQDLSTHSNEIVFLKTVYKRLEEDGVENRKVLAALNTTLGNLNVTLGRFDERIRGVEQDLANK